MNKKIALEQDIIVETNGVTQTMKIPFGSRFDVNILLNVSGR